MSVCRLGGVPTFGGRVGAQPASQAVTVHLSTSRVKYQSRLKKQTVPSKGLKSAQIL